jgi:hypothetical protein
MKFGLRVLICVAVLVLPGSVLGADAVVDRPAGHLASVESFSSISDTGARSSAIFTELGKVLTHPRCLNCHPAGDRPHQGDTGRVHQPPVERGADGFGLPALRCPICPQIKDPARNGNRTLDALAEHIGEDHLVGWAWAPGHGRQSAPGTQKEAGALVAAWVKTGAVCPN